MTAGVTKKADLHGIYDLSLLNQILPPTASRPSPTAGLGASGK